MNADISLNFIALKEVPFRLMSFEDRPKTMKKKMMSTNIVFLCCWGKELMDSYIVSFFEKEGFIPL